MRSFTMLSLAALVLSGCKGTVTRGEDAETDTVADVEDVDVLADSPAETPWDTADAEPDGVDAADTNETVDPPPDVPADTIGMPCTTDEECDDGVFCDGEEYCHPSGECRRAPAPDCTDSDACTTDSCDPVADACRNVLVDGDGDLHAPESCGGDDCDDSAPAVFPGAPEACGDGVDQDCDGADNVDGECACAIDVAAPGSYGGSTTGMPGVHDPSCATAGGAPETIYELTITSPTDVLFAVDAPGWDAIVSVVDGPCGGAELGCAEDWDPPIILSLASGTYTVTVDGRDGGENGDFTLELDTCTWPSASSLGNDACSGAQAMTASGVYGGDSSLFVDDAQPATCAGGSVTRGGHDAWFTFTLTASATIHLDTTCTTFDTVLYVRSGSCTGPEVACNDDGGPGLAAELDATLGPGTYYVIVDGYSASSAGEYVLAVSGL